MELARGAPALQLHASLVEACLLRPWPGNVRELMAEVRSAAQAAVAAGASRVEAKHLSPSAGEHFSAPGDLEPSVTRESSPGLPRLPPSRARLASVLKRCEGNISAAARELGVHRTQLRRWMERHGLDARASRPGGDDGDG
jgi:transcriptional regulator of acetoin/glycerol metabolism